MGKKTGFTLLELMIVIAIIAVVSAIVAPNLIRYLPNYRLGQASRDMLATMQLSRLKAVKENASVVVLIDVGNNGYSAFVDDGAGGGTAGDRIRNGSEEIVRENSMPEGVELYQTTFSSGYAQFNSRGLPGNGIGSVRMRNGQGRYKGVSVNITGNSKAIISSDSGGSWEDE